jgi:hypothetical protein
MRDDLLGAQTSVDWAVAQIPILEHRLTQWVSNQAGTFIEEKDVVAHTKTLKLRINQIPAIISAEAGMIAHAIRSSLDITVSALAKRNGHLSVRDVYFPICSCVMDFMDPLGSMEKIKRLSKPDRQIIESLKPYPEGNPLLCALHQVDIARKHTRLLGVHFHINQIGMNEGTFEGGIYVPGTTKFVEDEAILLVVGKKSTYGKVSVGINLHFHEIEPVADKPVIATLHEFASLATAIIKLFDTP